MKDRYKKILELCKEETSVNDLIAYFDVSPSTIRRDLVDLEDLGLITRSYGTVMVNPEQSVEASNEYKALYMAKEKDLIARYAASLVEDGDIVYIDSGTTTSSIIEYISAKNILIITNSLDCVEKSKARSFDLSVIGGNYKKRTNALVSTETIEAVRRMSYKIAFIAGNGVHPLNGFSCFDELDAEIKKGVIANAIKTYICIDSSKFNQLKKVRFCNLAGANVITDSRVKDFDYSVFQEVVFVDEILKGKR